MTASNQNCGKWATVAEGDTCASISVAYGISLSDFYFLNPEISTDCTNLWLSYAYCVEAVGAITTYPGYQVTVPATSFARPTTTTTSITIGPPTLLPAAPGTRTDCVKSRDYYNLTSFDVLGQSYLANDFFPNDCSYMARMYAVTVNQLMAWNPSLNTGNCTFQPGYSYCVIHSYDGEPAPLPGPFSAFRGGVLWQKPTT